MRLPAFLLLVCAIACAGSNPPDLVAEAPAADAGAPPVVTAGAPDSDAGAPPPSGDGSSPSDDAGTPDGGLGILDGDRAAPAACDDGWCWANPLPFGDTLTAVTTSSSNDVWVMPASADYVRHWDGSGWSRISVIPGHSVTAIWSAGQNDVWAATQDSTLTTGTLLHWDGAAWTASGQVPG
jgi:hypothetical protein